MLGVDDKSEVSRGAGSATAQLVGHGVGLHHNLPEELVAERSNLE